MPVRYDKKGKSFTEVVTKDKLKVIIQTPTNQLSGHLHVPPDKRLKDEINRSSGFLALTDGRVINPDGSDGRAFDFVALNKDHIIWIIEMEVRKPEETPGGNL